LHFGYSEGKNISLLLWEYRSKDINGESLSSQRNEIICFLLWLHSGMICAQLLREKPYFNYLNSQQRDVLIRGSLST